jgi:hypothetical protein
LDKADFDAGKVEVSNIEFMSDAENVLNEKLCCEMGDSELLGLPSVGAGES